MMKSKPIRRANALRDLEIRRRRLYADVAQFKQRIAELQRTLGGVAGEIVEVEAEIESVKAAARKHESNDGLRVSDHALLRYCERVLGVDLQNAKNEIAGPAVVEMARKLGSGKYPVAEKGFIVVVNKDVAVTVENLKPQP